MEKWIILEESDLPKAMSAENLHMKISNFISKFATKVRKSDPDHFVELMMDDHVCINWKGKDYYIPENNASYDEADEFVYDYLNDNHHV